MSWTISSLCMFLLLSSLCPRPRYTAEANHARARNIADHGMVATDYGQCSTIGRDVLQDGGHAVDAAVAAAFCLGVVSPASSGIGGGAFMLVRSADDGKTEVYDMRETASYHASENMYAGNATLKARGALSVATPGELAGLELAWKKYGKFSWKKLVEPAAKIAKNGFKISPFLYMEMTKAESGIMADKGLRNIFTSKNGSLLRSGDVCRNEQLAKTLEEISKHGSKPFYNGPIGQSLVDDVRKAGGILTLKDLWKYKVKVRKPVNFSVMGVEIFSIPPPSSGGACLSLVLNILAGYQHLYNVSGTLLSHREIEALKHAFAVRMNLGDPDFVNVTDVMKDMMSKDFAAKLRKTIFDNMTFDPGHYGGRWNQLHDHGTSHMSIIDGQRNAVSMTTSINGYFGSALLSQSTGIILNNLMDDFSIPRYNTSEDVPPPAPANFIRPGKRPLSSMSPTIVVKDGQPKGVVGASGGRNIIAATTQVLVNYLARGMDPLSCVRDPRLYHALIPNVVMYENWTVPTGNHFVVSAEKRDALKKKGHILQSLAGGTICQCVVQELNNSKATSGRLIGVSDPRKGGYPAGF